MQDFLGSYEVEGMFHLSDLSADSQFGDIVLHAFMEIYPHHWDCTTVDLILWP